MSLHKSTKDITQLILRAASVARKETSSEPEPSLTKPIQWPVECTVGPGLEGAIACESKIGYVNGAKGWLIYRGYDIFDLCAHSTFEEVSYLLLHGDLPTKSQLETFKDKLLQYRNIPNTLRLMSGFPVEHMNPMAALRFGCNLLRQVKTDVDSDEYEHDWASFIGADEDSIPMETRPMGEEHAIYEFRRKKAKRKAKKDKRIARLPVGYESCYQLIASLATIAAAVARLRKGSLPIAPDLNLSHAANFVYMLTGRRPDPIEERVMDVALILHADHGINASTFASMVVASTLSDIYFAVGAGISALNGSLHGGANEKVLHMLEDIDGPHNVKSWYKKALVKKERIMGFGHRVYKAYDPRARVLGPLAKYLVETRGDKHSQNLFRTATELEKEIVPTLGAKKKIFPNVDFYSGIVYSCLGISSENFTPIFAASRVSGWTARVMEYMENNRIFRPRAMYVGPFNKKYTSIKKRRIPGKPRKTKKK